MISSDPDCKGPLLIYSTAAQIINIHHTKYQQNDHQQILIYKKVKSCLLILFTFSTKLNTTMTKLNDLFYFLFFFILSS